MKTLSMNQMTKVNAGISRDNNIAATCMIAGATAGLTCALIPWVGALVFAGTTAACMLDKRY